MPDIADMKFVIYLDCSEENMVQRHGNRDDTYSAGSQEADADVLHKSADGSEHIWIFRNHLCTQWVRNDLSCELSLILLHLALFGAQTGRAKKATQILE